MLDQGAENLVKRVGSKVYDACRGGSLKLSGFPDFTGLVEAIQKGQASQVPKAYNVCVMKGESLRILKSLAQKFLDHELTHDKALGVIEDHNKKHNCDSDYLEPDAAPLVLQNSPNKLLLLSLHYIALTLLPETHTVEQRNEAPEEDLERAPKRIKLEPTDTVSDADISTLENPSLGVTKQTD